MSYVYLSEASPKTMKGEKFNFLTAILYLSPEKSAGLGKNVCPFATAGCIATCLNTAGRAGIFKKGETSNVIQRARQRKTAAFFADRTAFVDQLQRDIDTLKRRAKTKGMRPAVRLNGTSDLEFHIFARQLFTNNPDVKFYDYTKSMMRALAFSDGKLPKNYHVTFSRSEKTTVHEIRDLLRFGVNVAVPYRGNMRQLATALGVKAPVTNGDLTDLRFRDRSGVIVALTAKGKAKKDKSGFVVDAF